MTFKVPYADPDSTTEEDTFFSQESNTMSLNEAGESSMNIDTPSGPQIPQGQSSQQHEEVNFDNIPPALYQALLQKVTQDLLNQNFNFQQSYQQQVPNPSPNISLQNILPELYSTNPQTLSPSRDTGNWPMWNEETTSIDSHIFQIKVRIEKQRSALGSDRNVCLSIFNLIPSEKHPRILNWFETGGPNSNYDWAEFLNHIKIQFGDKKARQIAGNLLSCMKMGSSQYFSDFLQDLEIKLSQCGGTKSDDESKISLLETAINAPLRQLLLNKSLPTDDYQKWISKVRIVAARLENTPSY